MMNKTITGLLTLALLVLGSCTDTDLKAVKTTAPSDMPTVEQLTSRLEKDRIQPIFLAPTDAEAGQFICLYSLDTSTRNNPYFQADTAVRIFVATLQLQQDGSLKQQQKALAVSTDWTYCTIDSNIKIETINEQRFLSLIVNTAFMGTAVTERQIDFILIALKDLTQYTLSFTGTPSWKCDDCLEGKTTNEDALKSHPELLAYLRQEIAGYPGIYKPSEADKDGYDVLNYETKWETENHADFHLANGHGNVPEALRTTYYHTNLFSAQRGSGFDTTENEQYQFVSYFCGSVIGYDKEKRLWFPVMIESCNGFCSKTISLENGLLSIRYEDGEETALPLNRLIFDQQTGH